MGGFHDYVHLAMCYVYQAMTNGQCSFCYIAFYVDQTTLQVNVLCALFGLTNGSSILDPWHFF